MNKLKRYNIRVYGILINSKEEVLLSRESAFGKKFVKFPGGGHQLGEGIKDTLIREFGEELGMIVKVENHFYTTDFCQVSAFDEEEQLISIYYKVSAESADRLKNNTPAIDSEKEHFFFWKELKDLKKEDVSFPVDQLVAEQLVVRNFTE